MIRKSNKAAILQRLKQLQSKVDSKSSIPIVLSLEEWLNSDDQCSSFCEYIFKHENKNPNSVIIIDDMVIQTDMYIDTGIILNSEKNVINTFVTLANTEDEEQYMKRYIELFLLYDDVGDLDDSFYSDFSNHYKILPVGELVKRYKDQRYFTPHKA